MLGGQEDGRLDRRPAGTLRHRCTAHPVMDTYVDPLRLRIFDPSGIVAPDGMACLSDENSRVEIQARRGPFAMHQILRMSARVEISA